MARRARRETRRSARRRSLCGLRRRLPSFRILAALHGFHRRREVGGGSTAGAGSGTNRRPSVMQGREHTGLLLTRGAASAARRGPPRRRAGVTAADCVLPVSQGDEGLCSGVTRAAECGQRVVDRLQGRWDTRRTCGIECVDVKALGSRPERVGVVVETDGWIGHAGHVPRPRRLDRWVRASNRRGWRPRTRPPFGPMPRSRSHAWEA
jgi:hypothetical protein